MNPEQQKTLEQQRNTWNQFSSGWKKWDAFLMEGMRPVSDTLINAVAVRENQRVLDVASGTGEPGLTLAAKLPKGRVTGTDLAEEMVWEVMSDIAGPVMQALNDAPAEIFVDVKNAVLEACQKFERDGAICFNWTAIIATGEA